MPEGTPYFCFSRTVRKSHGGYGAPETLMAIGLGCHVRDAHRIVYADRVDMTNPQSAVPIGVTCRLCDRVECDQRAFPPIQHRLKIDENVRAASFFSPAIARENTK